MFRLLLGPKNVPTFVERTLQRQFHLMFLQDWHPSLKRWGKNYLLFRNYSDNYHFSKIYIVSLQYAWHASLKKTNWSDKNSFTFCTILLTTDARSRGHDILNTLGPGHGITDNSNTIKTWKKTHHSPLSLSLISSLYFLSNNLCMHGRKKKKNYHETVDYLSPLHRWSFLCLRLYSIPISRVTCV